ncbi:ABC transporter substrate-binding protein [Micrococcoides hystricis]|uniref:ABC transporter substrate-binding protein n=1 Tax=Micrococcoides hystricis TaxID=1572761 RepID=A0ABV6PAR5_9MICC
MNIRRLGATAAALVLATTLAACGDSGGSNVGGGDTQTLKVGLIGIGSDAAVKIAEEEGYFAEENIKVESTVVANPPAGIAAAQSGQLDIAYAPSIPVLNALSENVPLKVIGAADGYPENSEDVEPRDLDDTGLFANPDAGINSPKDLEGKSVSVPARKAQLEVTIANSVSEDGGDPSKINWMVLDPSSALQSLQQKRVDAVGLVSPFTARASSEGGKYVASPGVEFFGEGAIGLWVAGESTTENKAEAIASFQRAMKKANEYANENYEEAEQYASELTNIPVETLKEGAHTYWPTDVTLEQIQDVNKKLADLGYLSKEVELDDSLILESK